MSAYPKEFSEVQREATHVIPASNSVIIVASPYFSSQPHLRVIALIIASAVGN